MSESPEKLVLRAVLELFQDRRRWTRYALARTAKGKETDPLAPDAVRWCVRGALRKEAYALTGNEAAADGLRRRCEAAIGRSGGLEEWQDQQKIAVVRAELQEALNSYGRTPQGVEPEADVSGRPASPVHADSSADERDVAENKSC